MFTKLILSPLRLAVGWGAYPRFLGTIGVLMLVLLRVTIGWHFYSEGVDKRAGSWSAEPFFANASGPLAEQFHRLVPDREGMARLDLEVTKPHLAVYRERAIRHYGFDKAQQLAAKEAYVSAIKQITYELETNAAEIEEYKLGQARVKQLLEDPARDGVSSLAGQRDTIQTEWKRLAVPILVRIDTIWTEYEKAVNDLATEQQERRGYLRLYKPGDQQVSPTQLEQINRWIPYFDLVVGICLILGLLTPAVSLAAAAFLFSVFLSQYPPTSGPGSTYYQLIEAMACLVLAGTGAGRFAGLDFVLHALVRRFWPSEEE
ncbi:DoxX family protein [Roseimaritima sediminicola]|uniref:DoxX family protein n=1 Tax=Roseimaritima sediminicola TaxID=2662066 RepID=UPI0012985666|nr:DoxX family protein [Roseimaritima sediminicola]